MKSLITADEARALNKDMRIYVNLVERIKIAALNGNVQTNTSFMSEDLQNRLEMDGFKVKKNNPKHFDLWWISWKSEK